MKGAFTLDTPRDLLDKLESDYSDLIRDRNNPYLAFNFFVTAEHMLDWIYPGYANKNRREADRNNEVLLQICSHLATGAKHFVAEAKHHSSVANSVRKRPSNPFAGPLGGPFVHKRGISGLCVVLEGNARSLFGSTVHVTALAKKVLEYWRNHKHFTHAVS